LPAQTFPEGVTRDQRFELPADLTVTPQPKVRFDPALERADPELLQPGPLGLCERFRCELGERRPAPQRQRLAESVGRLPGAPCVQCRPRRRHGGLESVEIELLPLEHDRISRRPRVERSRGQHLTQVRDVDLHHLLRRLGHVLAPELVDDALDRERPVGVDEKERQEGALLAAPQPHLALSVANLERSKDSKVHPRAPS
jgi:hypothetical protein